MKKRAWRKAREMGELHNSITKGAGNIAGFLGEEIANSLIGGEINNTFDYDIIKDGVKIDVKTKRCTSEPKPHYDCSIAAYSKKQGCDQYVFVRIENKGGRWGRAWVLGCMNKKEFFKRARFMKKGEIDSSNGFKVQADCYNLAIEELNDICQKYKNT